jgi:polar amino acid transport system permease protein
MSKVPDTGKKSAAGRSILIGLIVLAVLAFACWNVLASLRYSTWNWPGIWAQREMIFRGWLLTIGIAAAALVGTFILGLLLAAGQQAREPVTRFVSRAFVEVVRGTPLLTQLLLGYYIIVSAFHLNDKIAAGILLLVIFESAYMAEILRGGVASIDRAQWDAAKALGLTPVQTWRLVILPQAFRRVLPGIAGQSASLVKDSSLLSVIGVSEFAKQTEIAVSNTSAPLEGFIPMAVGYLILTLPLSWLARRWEQRMKTS